MENGFPELKAIGARIHPKGQRKSAIEGCSGLNTNKAAVGALFGAVVLQFVTYMVFKREVTVKEDAPR